MRISIIAWLCVIQLVANPASAELPRHTPVPGGIAVIQLAATSKPDVHVGTRRVAVVRDGNQWAAVFGIALDTPPGDLAYTVKLKSGVENRSVRIMQRQYREQHLTIKEKRYVDPSPAELARYQREREEMNSARSSWTETGGLDVFAEAPVAGPQSDSFGSRRFYNGQPRNPHSGMDIAAASGTAIVAPAPGRVVATGNYFFNGNTVMIDHGEGLVSMYCHLATIDTAPGDSLEAGQKLGSVGATGRVTGAHLHWGVYLSGVAIDPAMMLAASARQ